MGNIYKFLPMPCCTPNLTVAALLLYSLVLGWKARYLFCLFKGQQMSAFTEESVAFVCFQRSLVLWNKYMWSLAKDTKPSRLSKIPNFWCISLNNLLLRYSCNPILYPLCLPTSLLNVKSKAMFDHVKVREWKWKYGDRMFNMRLRNQPTNQQNLYHLKLKVYKQKKSQTTNEHQTELADLDLCKMSTTFTLVAAH